MTGKGAGRPRHTESGRAGAGGRAQILDAAAELFTSQGYGTATTRQIADAVGVRQASIYYHFSNKQEILGELLADTVVPSLERSKSLKASSAPALVQLYALTCFDVALLSNGAWNIASLYTMPELRSAEFATFRDERGRLRRAYGERVRSAIREGQIGAQNEAVSTALIFALVESVIDVRVEGQKPDKDMPELVAAAVLRVLGCTESRIQQTRVRAVALMEQI